MEAPAGLSLSPPVQVLSLPAGLLEEFGWSRVEAHTEARAEVLVEILRELSAEDCGHSWRSYLGELQNEEGEGRVLSLLERMQAHRPTALFIYRARLATGSWETVALATISDRVRVEFEHVGFPVLARCFIRPAFRGGGLYPHLVRHRIRLCQNHWGAELRAIHIGAANPAIRMALSRDMGFDPSFVYVGDERLLVAGQNYRVEDMVASTLRYREEMQAALPWSTEAQKSLRVAVDTFLKRGAETVSHRQLRSDWEALKLAAPLPLQQLFDLLDGIGVLR